MDINYISMDYNSNMLEVRFDTRSDMKQAHDMLTNPPVPAPAPHVDQRGLLDIKFVVKGLMKAGLKIHAIKLVRMFSDMGLLEAKSYVESLNLDNHFE